MHGDGNGHGDLAGHMTRRLIDQHATRIPQSSGLLPCLYVPIGARDTAAISLYVGDIVRELSRPSLEKAFLVAAHEADPPDERLPIWGHPRAPILHSPIQVWVHVDYTAYRRAYVRAFSDDCLDNRVIDHVLNRRVARLKGFAYLRVVPISRPTNSSHGGLSEGWSVDLHRSLAMQVRNRMSEAMVQYADIADIVKMLDMEGGGGNMSIVNDAQKLVDLPADR